MAKYKTLKSIAHNTAHSYLSLMNYIQGNYVVEYIFQLAKDNKSPYVKIDILNKAIEPVIFGISPILESLQYLNNSFFSLLSAEHLGREHIKSASIKIEFDLNSIKKSESNPQLELPSYKCISSIEDINGKVHEANVVEWWKY